MENQILGELNIIHFNDVYEVRERDNEVCGGAARFCTYVNSFKAPGEDKDPLVLFSGDLWSPSKRKPLCLPSELYFPRRTLGRPNEQNWDRCGRFRKP
jgi:hypothetical protein